MSPALWQNWNRNFAFRPERLHRPKHIDDVAGIVRKARAAGRCLRAVGAGYSYTPLVETSQDLVSLDAFAGIEAIDLTTDTATVGAGIRLQALADGLAERGVALANLGDIDAQSLAGAIATGTHGTGITVPSLSGEITGMTLVDGRGEVQVLDIARDPGPMAAARVSLGALGIITSLTLKVEPLYHLCVERGAAEFPAVLRNLNRLVRDNRNVEFFWYPNDGLTYLKRMNRAHPESLGTWRKIKRWADDIVVENGLLWAACRSCLVWPKLRAAWLRYGRSGLPTDSSVWPADRAYPTPRLVRHYEIEYSVPFARAVEALTALDELHQRHPVQTIIPIEVRFGPAEDSLLNTAYGREVVHISVHAYRGEEYKRYFDRCEELFLAFDGRPHWGKMHNLRAAELALRCPCWEDFQSIRKQFDSDGVFSNPYLKDLLGVT
jgi:FAD-linked oxidoreductase